MVLRASLRISRTSSVDDDEERVAVLRRAVDLAALAAVHARGRGGRGRRRTSIRPPANRRRRREDRCRIVSVTSGASSDSRSSSVSWSLAAIQRSGGSATSSPSSLRISSESSCSSGVSGDVVELVTGHAAMLPRRAMGETARFIDIDREELRRTGSATGCRTMVAADPDGSEALCATTLADRVQLRTRPYGTVSRCSNRGRRHGTRDFGDFSLTPPAGRAGVGAVERRHPTWRSRLPAPPSAVIFARCQQR